MAKLRIETDSTAGTFESTRSAAAEGFTIIKCFLMSKQGGLQRYQLEVSAVEVRIVSSSSGSVKFALDLNQLQVKTVSKVERDNSLANEDVTGPAAQ